MCILSKKHLTVPPGLGQRQQSVSLTFSVFLLGCKVSSASSFFTKSEEEDDENGMLLRRARRTDE